MLTAFCLTSNESRYTMSLTKSILKELSPNLGVGVDVSVPLTTLSDFTL